MMISDRDYVKSSFSICLQAYTLEPDSEDVKK